MKRILPFIMFSITSGICYSQKNSTYQPPAFADTGRIKKMQAAFPVIEQLYKDHAEKAHFPAMAFGIVADGKLIWSGGIVIPMLIKKFLQLPHLSFGLHL